MKVVINQFLKLFDDFSKAEQLEIAKMIEKQTFEDRWRIMDSNMPDVDFFDEEIMEEVRAVRYANKKD